MCSVTFSTVADITDGMLCYGIVGFTTLPTHKRLVFRASQMTDAKLSLNKIEM